MEEPSVKMTIRVLESWHKNLKVEAALRGTTIAHIVKVAVDEYLRNHPREEESRNGQASR